MRIGEGMVVGTMYRRGFGRACQWALCTAEDWGGRGNGHYMQDMIGEGMTVNNMCRYHIPGK